MAEQIFLVEFPDEGRVVLEWLRKHRPPEGSCLIIGIGPRVRAWLRARGVQSVDTTPFFDNGAHERVLRTTGAVMESIRTGLSPDRGDDHEDTWRQKLAFSVHNRLAVALRNIELLSAIDGSYPEAELIVCDTRSGSLLTSISREYVRTGSAPLTILPPGSSFPARVRRSRRDQASGSRRYRGALLRRFARAAAGRFSRSGGSRDPAAPGRIPLIITTDHFALQQLGREISSSHPGVRLRTIVQSRESLRRMAAACLSRRGGFHPVRRITTLLETLSINAFHLADDGSTAPDREAALRTSITEYLERERSRFSHLGYTLDDQIREALMGEGYEEVIRLRRWLGALESILGRLRPALFLSHYGAGMGAGIAGLFRKAGIPSMVIPLKTIVSSGDELEEIGQHQIIGQAMVRDVFSHAAAQSPLALEYLEDSGYSGVVVRTGPLVLQRAGGEERSRRRREITGADGSGARTVLYAPSMKRICFHHVTETLDEVMRSMADVVEAVSSRGDALLLIRLHPDGVVRKEMVEELVDLSGNTLIIDGHSEGGRASFIRDLAAADLLITNMSTSSEEAIGSGVPVILYDRWQRYNHLKAPEPDPDHPLELSPAYYVPGSDRLEPVLNQVLDHHPVGAAIPAERGGRYLFQRDFRSAFDDFVGECIDRAGRERG